MRCSSRLLLHLALPLVAFGSVAACSGDDATVDDDGGAEGGAEIRRDAQAPVDGASQPDAAVDAAADATVTEDAGDASSAGDASDADAADAGDADDVDAADAADAGVDAADADAAPPSYEVGGALSGLAANDAVTLEDNGGDALTLSANAPFVFPTHLASGAAYVVTVSANPGTPTAQECTVTSGGGVIGTTDITGVLVHCVNAYYVDPSAGSNGNPGTQAAPWKTLTYAVANAAIAGAVIHVQPGVYSASSGETFPVIVHSNQSVVGDPFHQGRGNVATQFSGSASYTGSSASATSYATLVVPSGATNVSISGLEIGNVVATLDAMQVASIIVDNASASISSNSFGSDGTSELLIANGSAVAVTSNFFNGIDTGLVISDPTTTVRARTNDFVIARNVVVNSGTLANLDFGTATDKGGNVFFLSGSTSPHPQNVVLLVSSGTGTMPVAGNHWMRDVQGADDNGLYPTAAVVNGPTGNPNSNTANYALPTGASLQF